MKNIKGLKKLRRTALLTALLLMLGWLFGCAPRDGNVAQPTASIVGDVLKAARLLGEKAGDDGSGSVPAKRGKWTVMLYFCGADLETDYGLASGNISEVLGAHIPAGMNVLLETGGAYDWSNRSVDPDRTERYLLRSGAMIRQESMPMANMGEAQTLGEFIAWGQKNYPAEKYMIILWDHGGGSVGGVCFDERYGNDSLDMNELREAFAMAEEPFELVGFDTCLTASIETAAAVADHARYMVASEEIVPGRGWSYDGFLSYIAENPDCRGKELGQVICDTYYSKCKVTRDESYATLSVVDLSVLPELINSVGRMMHEMTGVTGDIRAFRTLSQAVRRTENYGGNSDSEGYTNMIDLGDLVVNAKGVLPETSGEVLKALFDTVVYQVHGESKKNAHGLSIYYPLLSSEWELDLYGEQRWCANYLRYLESIVPEWSAPVWAQQQADTVNVAPVQLRSEYRVELKNYFNDDGYVIDIVNGAEAVETVEFAMYYIDYEYNEYMLLGYDNDIDHNWEQMRFTDNVRGAWPTINGIICSPSLIAAAERYNVYSIPILLNDEQTNLRAAYIWNDDGTGYFKILGVWDGVDQNTGMSARGMKKLEMGDEVAPLVEGINIDTGEVQLYTYGSFVYDGETEIKDDYLGDGEYLYYFIVRDIFGNEFYSENIIIEINGENINMHY